MAITEKNIDKIYEQNLQFWDEAWKRVAKPHKELPKLPYIHEITRKLKKIQRKKSFRFRMWFWMAFNFYFKIRF